MNQTIDKVGKTLQTAYDEMYTDDISEWRELGGKHKARNILSVCDGKTFRKPTCYTARRKANARKPRKNSSR